MRYLMSVLFLVLWFASAAVADERDAAWPPVLVDIEGHEHRPFEQQRVEAFALVFIMTDCPISNSYVPELNRLYEWLKDKRLPLLLVHADASVSGEQAREHRREYQLRPPIVLDPQQTWAKRAGATRVPESVIFSADGEVLYRGRIDDRYPALGKRRVRATKHDLREAMEAVLAGKSVPHPQTEAVGCIIHFVDDSVHGAP